MTKQTQRGVEFAAELEALLKKYKAEISVEETTHGYERYASGIIVEFDGEVQNESYVQYEDLHYGTRIIP